MKYFSIPKPCSENWNEMTPTEKGAFCQKCAHEVHDVTRKSNAEIKDLFEQNKGKRTCLRMTVGQEKSLNSDFALTAVSKKKQMQRAMLFSLLVVFGFTLFSCNSPEQVKELETLKTAVATIERSQDVDSTKSIKKDSQAASKTEPIDQKMIPIEEELHLLGEPALFTEEVQVVEEKIQIEEYVTMGIPAFLPEIEVVEPVRTVETPIENALNEAGIPNFFEALTFPNPATTETRLEVKLPERTENLQIRLLDMTGKVIQLINEAPSEAGVHSFNVPLSDLKPAYYLFDIRFNDKRKVVRLSKV